MALTTDSFLMQFLESFNADLSRLGCGARVAPVSGSAREMEIVDLDGAVIGRVPTKIEPEVFAAFMLIVEQSFADGQRAADQGRRLS